jgi:hypothetical protein
MEQKKKKHHYIPRYYLRSFSDPRNEPYFYVYQRNSDKVINTTPERTAFENNFYTVYEHDGSQDSNSIEDYLANDVESPARAILDKIKRLELPSSEEKLTLSKYIVYLIKRVPRGKARIKELTPRIVERQKSEFDQEIDTAISKKPDKREFLEQRRRDIHQILESYREEIPSGIAMGILRYPSPRLTATINNMTWRFLINPGEQFYVTSDNPVFFDEGLGVNNTYSEVSVPISRDIALWITWRSDFTDEFILTTRQAVKEINRRTVGYATRFVYSPTAGEWISTILKKNQIRVTALR